MDLTIVPQEDGSKGAVIDGRYRYNLWRSWDERNLSRVLFIGLNPSTADAVADDPTIRRCVRFARDWGYGGMWMANLYALRATLPARLVDADDPVGPLNDQWLRVLAELAELTVAAWGAWPGPDLHRPAAVMDLVGGLHVLGLTKHGEPRHPLYMRADVEPVRWSHG
jgi:hypothetical protein